MWMEAPRRQTLSRMPRTTMAKVGWQHSAGIRDNNRNLRISWSMAHTAHQTDLM